MAVASITRKSSARGIGDGGLDEQTMENYQRWKKYQRSLQRKDFQKRFFSRGGWLFPLLVVLGLGIQFFRVDLSTGSLKSSLGLKGLLERDAASTFSELTKKDLGRIIDAKALLESPDGKINFIHSGRPFSAVSTLDSSLQEYMSRKIGRSKSPLITLVAMDPATGQIHALIDSKKTNWTKSGCLNRLFPAASVFKIVSAAAAIDRCGISANAELSYNGRKHTLYKNQLTNRKNRYTNRVSLKDAFAKSINPAFGKLGIFRLKKDLLEEYAMRFGFNRPIDFELPVEPSRISIGDDPYHWAEVACGFNRETLISPIHGAMIAAAVINGGKLVEPTLVRHITDTKQQPVYGDAPVVIKQAISPETSEEMKELMTATISRGTSRRAFRGYSRDRVLSRLLIGGKTGSIKNDTDELLYDWFVGFGKEKEGPKKLALAVLVVHDKLLRARAHEYARLALKHYFRKSPTTS